MYLVQFPDLIGCYWFYLALFCVFVSLGFGVGICLPCLRCVCGWVELAVNAALWSISGCVLQIVFVDFGVCNYGVVGFFRFAFVFICCFVKVWVYLCCFYL